MTGTSGAFCLNNYWNSSNSTTNHLLDWSIRSIPTSTRNAFNSQAVSPIRWLLACASTPNTPTKRTQQHDVALLIWMWSPAQTRFPPHMGHQPILQNPLSFCIVATVRTIKWEITHHNIQRKSQQFRLLFFDRHSASFLITYQERLQMSGFYHENTDKKYFALINVKLQIWVTSMFSIRWVFIAVSIAIAPDYAYASVHMRPYCNPLWNILYSIM